MGLFPVYRLEEAEGLLKEGGVWVSDGALRACSYKTRPKPKLQGEAPRLFKGFILVFVFHIWYKPRATRATLPRNLEPPAQSPEMLKSNFFSAKNFNIFYDFSRKKNPTSAIRSPIKPRKFPIKPRKFPIKPRKFPTSDVFHALYWPKKEEKTPCLGLSPLR